MRPFYLFKSKHGIFYVQFSNEMTHERCSALSTRERSYTAAMKVACKWMRNGIPSKTGNRIVESAMVAKNNSHPGCLVRLDKKRKVTERASGITSGHL